MTIFHPLGKPKRGENAAADINNKGTNNNGEDFESTKGVYVFAKRS
jgi:hypothetical protein